MPEPTSLETISSLWIRKSCSQLKLELSSLKKASLSLEGPGAGSKKHYGFSVDYLDLLFKSLILSIFTYAIEVWGGAFYNKYLSRIDKFLNRAFKLGYTKVCYSVLNILSEKDRQLWEKIKSPDNPLHHLLPPTRDRVLRNRGHSFIIPRIRTERFKSIFINRNLLSFR